MDKGKAVMGTGRRWAVDFSDQSTVPSSRDILDPPGFSRASPEQDDSATSRQKKDAEANWKLQKAWEVAQSPFKNLMMMGFMMWMAGNTVHLFSIGITFSALWQPLSALQSVGKIFEPFKDNKVELLMPKLVFLALNLGGLALGIWKLNTLGLLPTHASDWVSSLPPPQTRMNNVLDQSIEALSYFKIPETFYSIQKVPRWTSSCYGKLGQVLGEAQDVKQSAVFRIMKHPDPCNHLSDYKLRHGTDGYKSFQNMFTCLNDGRIKIKLQTPRCSHCSLLHHHPHNNKRLYICLICRSISCSSHLLSHTQSNKGHDLSIDVERSELYCSSCVDQVYDPDFDEAVVSKHLLAGGNNGVSAVGVRSNKKRRLSADASQKLIIGSKQFLVDRREKWSFPLGLRGLNNLGSTCFMNAVLQALVHAPPLRNFWLSGQHNRDLCERRSMGLLCLPCDLDVIFSAMFSGDRTPYSPAHLLYSWWQHSTNLATYEQQDSHEFFISLLDCIHENEGKSKCLYKDHEECQCITHRAFSGLLRSDVTCTTCGSTSTTYDPFIDISLTLDSSTDRRKSRNSGEPSVNAPMPTLSGCLDLFTRSEKLGPDQKLNCQSCGDKRESSKQMSIRRLPPLLCLHVKRFEHSLTRKASRKIDSYLQYPFRLNMSPYLSSSIIGKRFGNRMFDFDGEGEHDGSSSSAEFEIFAVVTHSGMLASGHYVTYLRLKGLWYRCDDAWINEVEEEVVRGCECYMLFYAQERVIQKAHKELSYQVISMADSFPFV
ncbi:hypothetical protein Bca4012_024407 [Brassica carinata]